MGRGASAGREGGGEGEGREQRGRRQGEERSSSKRPRERDCVGLGLLEGFSQKCLVAWGSFIFSLIHVELNFNMRNYMNVVPIRFGLLH